MSNQPPIKTIAYITKELLKRKDITAIGKLIVCFLSTQRNIDEAGGIKSTIKEVADGIGEASRNVRKHVNILKKKNIIIFKGGRYPRFYFEDSIRHYDVTLKNSIRHYDVKLNEKPETLPYNSSDKKESDKKTDFVKIKKRHENLKPVLELIPNKILNDMDKGGIEAINWRLHTNNPGIAYFEYLGRVSCDSGIKSPVGYFMGGVWKNYADFLNSPEHGIAEFKLLGR